MKKKAKRGRPPIPEGERRSVVLTARFTPDEVRSVEQTAKNVGQDKTVWIRNTVLASVGGLDAASLGLAIRDCR